MIHSDNPFVDDPDSRDPVRRFRGRLAAPVTIVTSGDDQNRAGLTVSSLMILEGEPGHTRVVVGPTTDLWETVAETGRFIIHVCNERHRHVAEVFAGLRPSPGGVFAGLEVSGSEWGPVIDDMGTRVFCSFLSREETGYVGVVAGVIDRIEVRELTDPLLYFRGGYHSLH